LRNSALHLGVNDIPIQTEIELANRDTARTMTDFHWHDDLANQKQ